MTRKVFYSFHYDNDAWRAAQVRNMGVVDSSEPIREEIAGKMLKLNLITKLRNVLTII